MKKILAYSLIAGSFLAGNFVGGGENSSASSKFCTAYSYYSSCYNTARNDEIDYEITRQDTARTAGSSAIEFSSSYFETSIWSPQYGSGSFIQGHWIYEATTGNIYQNTSINGRDINGTDFYVANNTGGSVGYAYGKEPEVTTQIRNGGTYGGSTFMVSAYQQ